MMISHSRDRQLARDGGGEWEGKWELERERERWVRQVQAIDSLRHHHHHHRLNVALVFSVCCGVDRNNLATAGTHTYSLLSTHTHTHYSLAFSRIGCDSIGLYRIGLFWSQLHVTSVSNASIYGHRVWCLVLPAAVIHAPGHLSCHILLRAAVYGQFCTFFLTFYGRLL